ncbi:hypothetical protein KUCAC02_006951 [Chaenocephalus aceratus]|uniref:Uncharacterized protein n=1 Tax=Chaenocephalus aceratus TaxID=36190 RepID=A0ACB9VT69_CHAAC|nr:hypothetical protein KUCAC02_006951 [Chaenocephalus aceratus]
MASTEGNTQTSKMTSLDNDINQHFQDAIDVIQQHSNNSYYNSEYTYMRLLVRSSNLCSVKSPAAWSRTRLMYRLQFTTGMTWLSSPGLRSSRTFPWRNSKSGRKKLRLYEYLHEALNDPNMGDSIQWTDNSSGTFHFISKNKEKLAECWGQRKGNRKTMTYQKMARALRNYSRTGEIIKVRRKLTYQFNPDILHRLGSAHLPCRPAAQEEAHPRQPSPAEQSYCGPAAADWHTWYGHYQQQEDYDLASSFTSQNTTKL